MKQIITILFFITCSLSIELCIDALESSKSFDYIDYFAHCLVNILESSHLKQQEKIWDEGNGEASSSIEAIDYLTLFADEYRKILVCFDQFENNIHSNSNKKQETDVNLSGKCLDSDIDSTCVLQRYVKEVLAYLEELDHLEDKEGRVKERIKEAENKVKTKYPPDDKIAITFDQDGILLNAIRSIISKVFAVKGTGRWSSTLVINQLINRYLAKRVDGVIELDLRDKITNLGIQLLPIDKSHTLILLLSQIDIIGLDTFCSIDLLKPVGKYTLQHKICLDYITVSISFQILDKRRPNKVKVFTFTMQLKDLDMSFSTLIALDEIGIFDLEPGGLIRSDDFGKILECLLTMLADFGILELDIGKHAQLSMLLHSNPANTKEEQIKEIARLDKLLQDMMKMNHWNIKFILASLDTMVGDIISPMMSKFIANQKECQLSGLPFPPKRTNGPYVNFKSNPLMNVMSFILNEVIGTTGDASINKIVNALFGLKQGMLEIKGDVIKAEDISILPVFPSLGPQVTTLSIRVGNITIGPLDQFEKLSLFIPTTDNALDNTIMMKDISISVDLALKFVGLIRDEKEPMQNQVNIKMNVGKQNGRVSVSAGMFMNMNMEPIYHMSMKQLFSSCLFMLFPNHNSIGITSMNMDIGGLSASMHCHEYDGVSQCTSPMMKEIEKSMNNPTSVEKMNDMINWFMPALIEVMTGDPNAPNIFGGFNVQTGIDYLINKEQKVCLSEPTPAPTKPQEKPKWIPSMKKTMGIGASLMALGFVATIAYAHFIHKNQRKKQLTRLSTTPEVMAVVGTPMTGEASPSPSGASLSEPLSTPLLSLPMSRRLSLVQQRSPDGQTLLSDHDAIYIIGMDKPLLFHPSLRAPTRYIITLLLIFNFVFYVSGNFFIMGAISINATLAGEKVREISMLTLTLDECIDMLVEGRAVLFAAFIGGASGMLPWMRVALLLYCWVVPTTVLAPDSRQYMLRLLEKIGKWCYAQYYLFVILQSSVNVQMDAAKVMTFIPYDTISIIIECSPEWGLFTFLVATIFSILLNQYMIVLHEFTVLQNQAALDTHRNEDPGNYTLEASDRQLNDRNITLSTGVGNIIPVATSTNSDQPKPNPLLSLIDIRKSLFYTSYQKGLIWESFLVSFILIAWIPTLILAFVLNSYSFEFMGFSGFGIDLIGNGKKDDVSLSKLFSKLQHADGAKTMEPYEVDLMSICYLIFVLILPWFLCTITLVVWFLLSIENNAHSTFTWTLRSVRAWSGVEVFCCTILVVVLQIHKFFKSMSSTLTFCPMIVGNIIGDFGASDDESVCFGVQAKLMDGWFIVLSASILSMLCPTIILHFASKNEKQ